MRAVRFTGFGGPERLDYREDVPEPRPGPHEVRFRGGAAGSNNFFGKLVITLEAA